jgi:hypothetical protein
LVSPRSNLGAVFYGTIENELHSQNGYCLVFIENFAGKKSNKNKDLEHYKIVTLQHARDRLYCEHGKRNYTNESFLHVGLLAL